MRMKRTALNLSQRTFTLGAFGFADNYLLFYRAKQRGKGAPKKKRTAEREWIPQASPRHICLTFQYPESKKFAHRKKKKIV